MRVSFLLDHMTLHSFNNVIVFESFIINDENFQDFKLFPDQ